MLLLTAEFRLLGLSPPAVAHALVPCLQACIPGMSDAVCRVGGIQVGTHLVLLTLLHCAPLKSTSLQPEWCSCAHPY
jgi:hypothetical protein